MHYKLKEEFTYIRLMTTYGQVYQGLLIICHTERIGASSMQHLDDFDKTLGYGVLQQLAAAVGIQENVLPIVQNHLSYIRNAQSECFVDC